MIFYGKVLIASFNDKEEMIFQQTVDWLSKKLLCIPTTVIEQRYDFSINQYTKTFVDSKGLKIYLTVKEFDLFYLLFSHKEQVFSKEQLYENI